MENLKRKNDSNPYVVFTCAKCHQYLYVKKTQIVKKCLRCRKTHQVKIILDKGEIVYGISNAVNRIKELQNSFGNAQFSTETEFRVALKKNLKKYNLYTDTDYEKVFSNLLNTLSSKYREFPLYMIQLMAKDYQIPSLELKILIKKAIKEKSLILSKKKSYYRYNTP